MGPSDSVSMSPSAQPAAALAEEFGVRKAVLGGLKEHQSNTGKGKRSEWTKPQLCPRSFSRGGSRTGNRCFSQGPREAQEWPGTLVEWPPWGLAFGRRWKQSCLSHAWSLKAEL